MGRRAGAPQTLILDAGDTRWENNVHFERAIEEFLDFLAPAALSREEARAVLDEIERANAGVNGYGLAAFGHNLRRCYARLAGRPIRDEDLAAVMACGERILAQGMEPIAGVAEALPDLGRRHELVVMTKGQPEEQRLKIERSGFEGHFRHAAVVPEKDAAAYLAPVAELELEPARTWMVGNSPKSDVNPSLAAGLNAIFVPHARTWGLEREGLAAGPGRLLVLERFADLLEHFYGGMRKSCPDRGVGLARTSSARGPTGAASSAPTAKRVRQLLSKPL